MTTAKRSCENCGHSDNGMCDSDKGLLRADCTKGSKWTPDGDVMVDYYPGLAGAIEILCHKSGLVDSVSVLNAALADLRIGLVSHGTQ